MRKSNKKIEGQFGKSKRSKLKKMICSPDSASFDFGKDILEAHTKNIDVPKGNRMKAKTALKKAEKIRLRK